MGQVWSGIRVKPETYDKVVALAEANDATIGDTADALLSGAVDDFQEAVTELKTVVTAPRFKVGADKHKAGAALAIKTGRKAETEAETEAETYGCAKCQTPVTPGNPYCHQCGAKLNWDKVTVALETAPGEESSGSGGWLLGVALVVLYGLYKLRSQSAGGYSVL